MSTNKILEDLKNFLKSDEGKQSIKDFAEKLKKEDAFKERWQYKYTKYLESKTDEELSILFEIFHAHAEKRRDILYSQGIDSQSSLYDPLFEVFEKLGKEAPKDAYGDFSSAIFDWRGFRMELYCGQGCFYSLSKI